MPPVPNTAPFLFGCRTCGKRAYSSRKQARRAARIAHPGDHLRAYQCPHHPGFWHIGHLHRRGQDGIRRPRRRTTREFASAPRSFTPRTVPADHSPMQPTLPAAGPQQAA